MPDPVQRRATPRTMPRMSQEPTQHTRLDAAALLTHPAYRRGLRDMTRVLRAETAPVVAIALVRAATNS